MAVGDPYVFPGFHTPVLTRLSFQSHRLLFSHASAEVRGKNTPDRKFSTRYQTTIHISLTFPGFHKYQAKALQCLAKGQSQEKTQLDPMRLELGLS